DLQTQLTQQRAVYADAHPAIVTLLQSISALQEPSPQLLALRKEERDLQAEVDRLSARRLEGSASVARTPAPQTSSPRPGDKRAEALNAEYTRTRLRFAMEKYDVLLERIEAARIELDTARAAFKYRYGVVRPPIFPRRPEKPKVPLVLAAGLIAALGLGTLAAALADLWSGKILEFWQMGRGLGLPGLGEIPRPWGGPPTPPGHLISENGNRGLEWVLPGQVGSPGRGSGTPDRGSGRRGQPDQDESSDQDQGGGRASRADCLGRDPLALHAAAVVLAPAP